MAPAAAQLAERSGRMMRVAIVSPYAFDVPGGGQDQVARLISWLREEGHDAWAVAPGSGGPEGTRHVGKFRSVRGNRSRNPISLNPMAGRRVARAVADADVVHLHEPFMPIVSIGTLMAVEPPIVGTFHAHPEGAARQAYRLGRPLLRRLARRMAVATAVSAVAARAVEGMASVRIIPNGIDLDDYAPGVDAATDAERSGVVFLGRDDPRKGLDVLLQAWPLVRTVVPDATLTVLGADRSSGPDGVTFAGRVSEEDKRSALASASVFVAPNTGSESFGITVLEGMASGCAVVASDLDSFRAVGGDVATYAPVGDALALAAAMGDLLTDGPRRAELSSRGIQRSQRYGKDTVLGAYLLAYEEAIAGR